MEKQIRPGVYVSVLTRNAYVDRAATLTRPELTTFIMKAKPLRFAQSPSLIGHNIDADELLSTCKELEPDLEPETDYYVLRETPVHR